MVHEVENVEESLTMASEQLSNAVIRSFRSKASCSTYYGTHNRSVNFQRNKENFVYSVVDVAHRGVAFLRGQGERAGQSPQAFQEALDTAFEEVLAAGNLPNERAREACRADFQQVAKWVGLADVIQYHVLAPSRDLQVPAQCVAVESEEGPRLRTGQEIWDLHIQLGRTAEAIADPLSSRKRRAPTPLVMRLRRDRWNGMSLVEYMTEELRQENDSTRQAPLRRGEDMWFNPGSPTTTDATPPSIGDTGAFSALPAATQPQDPQSRLRQQQSIPEEARPPAVVAAAAPPIRKVKLGIRCGMRPMQLQQLSQLPTQQPPQPGLLPPCTDGAGPPAVPATWPPGRQPQPRPLEELVARHSPSDPPAGLAAPSSATLSLQQQPPLQPPPQPQPRPLEELVARHSPSDPPAGLAAPSSATLSLQQQPPLQPPPQPQPLEELAARHSPSDPPAGLAAPSSATLSLQQQPPLQPPPQPQPLEELAARHSPSDPPAGLAAPSSATLSLQQQPPLQPPPQPQPLEELAARHSPSDPPAGLAAPSSATLSLQQQPPLQPPPQPQPQPLEELVARHSPSDSSAGLAAPSSATLSLQQQPPLQPLPQPQPLEELAAAGYLSFLLRDDGPDVDGNDWPGGIPFSPWVAPLLQHRIQQPTPPTRAAGVGAPVGLAALSPATLLLQQQPPQQPPPLAGGGQLAAENSPAAGGEPAARTEVGPAAVAPAQQQADVGDLDEGLDEELAAEEELATEAAAASPGHDDDNLRKTMVKDALDVLNKQQGMNFLRLRAWWEPPDPVPFPPPPPEGLVTGPIAANHQQQQPRTAAAEPGTRFEKGQRAGTIKAFAKMIEDQRDITWDQAIAHWRSINVAVGAMPDDKLIDAWKKAAKAAGIAHGVPSKPRGARGEVTRGDPAVAVPGVDGIRPGVQADPRMRADTAALDWDAKVAAVESALAAPNPDGVRVQQLYDELRALACPVPNRAEILQRVYSRIAVAFSS
ncbi:hypothetical protein PLESTB_001408900 [Pleodorina starrii]|uniref:Uncharacterized protein n=1 Tax=Pleodorina starrii TaxID=330485 RepID=A0A9W6F7P3_9CHLO|nr:hypothetical protein PLESTB_001408900 [Pleodorina starrii]